jgi:hypothetical protein
MPSGSLIPPPTSPLAVPPPPPRSVKIEKDRVYVAMQPIPPDAPRLPAGKSLVAAVPYDGELQKSVSGDVAL